MLKKTIYVIGLVYCIVELAGPELVAIDNDEFITVVFCCQVSRDRDGHYEMGGALFLGKALRESHHRICSLADRST